MKKNRVKEKMLAFVLAAALCTGCGASEEALTMEADTVGNYYDRSGSDYDGSYGMGDSDYNGSISPEEAPAAVEHTDIREARKLIETVSLEVETKEFEQLMSALDVQIQELGGYVESMDTYNGSSYSDYRSLRSANLKVRIPGGHLNDFLKTVSEIGNIVRRNDNVDDVTLSYVDMESRRNTLRTEQERLLEFLDRAETIEEIITIEERLSEVRYQLESMESQLRTIDNLVDYSTVHISISEVKDLTPIDEPTVWERISEGFAESLDDIGNGMLELGIWFLIHIPYLALWGVLIAVIVLLLRRRSTNRQRKLEEQLRKAAPELRANHPQNMQDHGNGKDGNKTEL